MNKEEMIENLKTQIEEMKSLLDIKDPVDNNSLFAEDIRALEEAIKLIEAQEKEIEHYKNSYEAEKDRRKEETKYLEEQIRYWEESTKEACERLEDERWRE